MPKKSLMARRRVPLSPPQSRANLASRRFLPLLRGTQLGQEQRGQCSPVLGGVEKPYKAYARTPRRPLRVRLARQKIQAELERAETLELQGLSIACDEKAQQASDHQKDALRTVQKLVAKVLAQKRGWTFFGQQCRAFDKGLLDVIAQTMGVSVEECQRKPLEEPVALPECSLAEHFAKEGAPVLGEAGLKFAEEFYNYSAVITADEVLSEEVGSSVEWSRLSR